MVNYKCAHVDVGLVVSVHSVCIGAGTYSSRLLVALSVGVFGGGS